MSEGTLTRDQVEAIALAGKRLAVALAAQQDPGFRGLPQPQLTRAEVIMTAGSLQGLLRKLPRILEGPDGSSIDFLPVAGGIIALTELTKQVQAWGGDAKRLLPKAKDVLAAVAALRGTEAELAKIGQALRPGDGRTAAAAPGNTAGGESQKPEPASGEWCDYSSPALWAKYAGCHLATLKRRIKRLGIQMDRPTPTAKRWRFHPADVPRLKEKPA